MVSCFAMAGRRGSCRRFHGDLSVALQATTAAYGRGLRRATFAACSVHECRRMLMKACRLNTAQRWIDSGRLCCEMCQSFL